MLTVFILAGIRFIRQEPFAGKPWGFLIAMVIALGMHFLILLLTWSQVYGKLYITSYQWSPGEQEQNAFGMWQAMIGLGILSSSLLTGILILLKPERSANKVQEDTR